MVVVTSSVIITYPLLWPRQEFCGENQSLAGIEEERRRYQTISNFQPYSNSTSSALTLFYLLFFFSTSAEPFLSSHLAEILPISIVSSDMPSPAFTALWQIPATASPQTLGSQMIWSEKITFSATKSSSAIGSTRPNLTHMHLKPKHSQLTFCCFLISNVIQKKILSKLQ